MIQNIFSNFNYTMNYFCNPYTTMFGNYSAPSVFIPVNTFYPPFKMPALGNLFTLRQSASQSSTAVQRTTASTTNKGYSANALKNLKNAPILKNVPEQRKTAILNIVDKAAKQYNVDPKLILSVIHAESAFNPKAKSHCGAMGLMQLMPATAKQYGASNAYDMEQNVFAGTKFLSWLLKRYNGNVSLAVAAYNAGPGRVKGSVPKIKETQNYVAKVTQTLRSLG
jgi:soluble lytic murein transglycosylase-like protein